MVWQSLPSLLIVQVALYKGVYLLFQRCERTPESVKFDFRRCEMLPKVWIYCFNGVKKHQEVWNWILKGVKCYLICSKRVEWVCRQLGIFPPLTKPSSSSWSFTAKAVSLDSGKNFNIPSLALIFVLITSLFVVSNVEWMVSSWWIWIMATFNHEGVSFTTNHIYFRYQKSIDVPSNTPTNMTGYGAITLATTSWTNLGKENSILWLMTLKERYNYLQPTPCFLYLGTFLWNNLLAWSFFTWIGGTNHGWAALGALLGSWFFDGCLLLLGCPAIGQFHCGFLPNSNFKFWVIRFVW